MCEDEIPRRQATAITRRLRRARLEKQAPLEGFETGTPNSSAIAWQVRFRDRNCPCHKYAYAAAIRGPYWTGAAVPAGAGATVTVPHEQRREISRCSVTSARVRG